MTVLTDEEITRLAKARVGFRIHLLTYVAVNLLLVAIWWLSSGGQRPTLRDNSSAYFWPIWPMLGWGIGVAINGFVVYGGGADWQRREEEKIRSRQGRQ
jgi:2TM domain